MAVVYVATLTIKSDRMQDFIEEARRVKTLFERCGWKNVRLLSALVGGQATGSLAFVSETDDFAGWGTGTDRYFADPEGQELMSALSTSAAPVAAVQTAIWMDVPL